jgi:hypothetical protein
MAIFDSTASKPKRSMTPQSRRGMWLYCTGLLLLALLPWAWDSNPHRWHLLSPVIFRGKNWTEFVHGVALGVAVVLMVTGFIVQIRARASASGSKP